MNIVVPYHRQEEFLEDRMLFVRTGVISETMVKVPLLVASVIIVIAVMPMQPSFSTTRNLDLIIYPDGSTHVTAEIDIDPLGSNHELDLYGSTIDNFVAVGNDGFLLKSDIIGSQALIETFGSTTLRVEYDIHDLISKTGRVWTFSINSPSDFTLLLPKNSAIVGMTNLPLNMEIIDEQNQLTLPSGETEIDYLFSSAPIVPNPIDPIDPSVPETNSDYLTYAIIGGAAIAAVGGSFAISRAKKKSISETDPKVVQDDNKFLKTETIDVETIFRLKPDIREDDKEIVRFLANNGGYALESELRKKFLQPRTTMWRAVKRLERNGIIEIEKKDMQNLVRLRKHVEEEE